MFYEVDLPRPNEDIPVAEFYLKELERQLPPGKDDNAFLTFQGPYCCIMDAGTLGDYKNAKWLAENGRKFIISCASNRPSLLWLFLKQNLELHHWKSIQSNQMTALFYFAKKSKGQNKIVNLLFNTHTSSHNALSNHPKQYYIKKTKSYGMHDTSNHLGLQLWTSLHRCLEK